MEMSGENVPELRAANPVSLRAASKSEKPEEGEARALTDDELRELLGIVDGDSSDPDWDAPIPRVEQELKPHIGDTTAYDTFRERLHSDIKTIYYPCCGNDVTPSSAFPDAKVTYLEIDPKIVDVLKDAQFDAVVGDAATFRLEALADAVVVMNPGGIPLEAFDTFLDNIRSGGYVLCNNWPGPGAAEVFSKKSTVKPLGMIRYDVEAGKEIFDPKQDFSQSGMFVFEKV
jgi:hypothetical protein